MCFFLNLCVITLSPSFPVPQVGT
uniref:Uncharacterized protein n=1 Tax=Anguilla anguilla TaxID=7936 RepID=A0A0E9XJT8_ANGAN